MAEPAVKGYLVLTVEEASGKTQKDQFIWDTNAGGAIEAFVKVEVRGGARNVKAQTRKVALIGDKFTWQEELKLEVLEGANELRLILCREKFAGTKRGISIISACGIFVYDIIEAVPINKYFELFKPNGGGEGGMIRICMDFVKDLSELDGRRQDASQRNVQPAISFTQQSSAPAHGLQNVGSEEVAATVGQKASSKEGKRRNKLVLLPVALLVTAAAAAAGVVIHRQHRQKK